MYELEVCVDRIEDAVVAERAGATRIEFNQALSLSGLTPSPSSCRWLKSQLSIPLVAMVRPHDDGFVYSSQTQGIMLEECDELLAQRVDGIVVGALNENRELDLAFLKRVRNRVGSLELIMHRAFDEVDCQRTALEQLIDLGFDRVLTSGGAPSVPEGIERLKELVLQAGKRIEILPGGGVTSHNAGVVLQMTGAMQLHGSFKRLDSTRLEPDAKEISETVEIMINHVAS